MGTRQRAKQVPAEAVSGGPFRKSADVLNTDPTDSSWQEEAALLLLRSGFRPGDTTGQVQHVANAHRGDLRLVQCGMRCAA
jgi:hypothetical protein